MKKVKRIIEFQLHLSEFFLYVVVFFKIGNTSLDVFQGRSIKSKDLL